MLYYRAEIITKKKDRFGRNIVSTFVHDSMERAQERCEDYIKEKGINKDTVFIFVERCDTDYD